MAECFYCEKDNEKRKALMLDVCELPYSIVYLFRDQKNKGRCVVAFKGHKTEYFQLTPEENAGYFADVAKVAKVLDELYHPDKINYATYGDGMPHVHVHIVPKYKGGVSWGQPFSDSLPKVLLTDAEYDAMIADLRAKLLSRPVGGCLAPRRAFCLPQRANLAKTLALPRCFAYNDRCIVMPKKRVRSVFYMKLGIRVCNACNVS